MSSAWAWSYCGEGELALLLAELHLFGVGVEFEASRLECVSLAHQVLNVFKWCIYGMYSSGAYMEYGFGHPQSLNLRLLQLQLLLS